VSLPPIWVLASSGGTAAFAGSIGAGYGFARHFSPTPPGPPIRAYRDHFQRSPRFPAPHVILGVSVICAETEEEADDLATSSDLGWLMHAGRVLPQYDAVIPRIGASITHYGLAVLRQFEVQGVFPLNESVAIGRSRDKLRALQLLARDGIGLPVTAFAHGPHRAEDVIKAVGGTPCVIKLLEGAQGMGVILAETTASAKSIIEAFSTANINILVQEYIKEAGGTDVRVLVVDGEVVASMKRSGKIGDFRANLHRGGKAEPVAITEDERRTAIRSAEVLGLNVAGIDMLRSNRGPVVVEVNSSPGIEGMEQASGADVAGAIIQFLEKRAKRGETKTRGAG
jgi:ribosomal protein S6--L-glutamate ligase